MKSYIEPMNAADALDVLDLYGVDTPGAFISTERDGCIEIDRPDCIGLLGSRESVASFFGPDAATTLAQHAEFRKEALEIIRAALELGDIAYNVYSGTAFIPDMAPDGELFGFHVAHISLPALLDEDVDRLSPDACDYGLDFISETNEEAAGEAIDLSDEVEDDRFLSSIDWALCDIEYSVLATFGPGCSPRLAGWTLGNAESIAETCAMLGADAATVQAPGEPASVAAAAKAAARRSDSDGKAHVGAKL